MKKGLLVLFTLLASISINAQNDTLIWIGDEGITSEEFLAVYNKNKDVGRDIDPKTPKEYRQLFINFKLKVKEARELGKDTLTGFKREFGGYRAQLAKPYLVDESVEEVLMKEAYKRMQSDINVKHIMLDVAPDALPADTLEAYNKLIKIRKSILDGASFEEMAKQNSTDTYTAKKGGEIGYFTVFNMVYPFETVAYNTPVGEISKPVRSQYGYHIIKVEEKRPALGKVEVKHIFLIANKNSTPEQHAAAETKIKEIYSQFTEGADFELLAKQYSEDKNTASKGGLLAPFGINKMYPEFQNQSFGLENPGNVSEPFKTAIGWHIVKLVRKVPIGSYEENEASIKENIKSERASQGKSSLITKLKKEYSFKEYSKRLKDYKKVIDSDSYMKGQWDPAMASKLTKTMFILDNNNYTQKDFTAYLNTQQRNGRKSATVEQEVYKQYNQWVESEIIKYEDSNLENKYPEFKLLVNEYRDGILLFDLTEEKVWTKASKDSAGLYDFFKTNQKNYWWGERAEVAEVSCIDKKYAKKVLKLFYKGNRGPEILEELNKDSQLNVIVNSHLVERGQNETVDKFEWKRGETDFYNEDERVKFLYFIAILQPEPKKLEEARGIVISDYQKKLEAEWIAELRSKYPVKINEELFEKITQNID